MKGGGGNLEGVFLLFGWVGNKGGLIQNYDAKANKLDHFASSIFQVEQEIRNIQL